jgi:uracil-DNA glycosylase
MQAQPTTGQLQDWAPQHWALAPDWQPVWARFLRSAAAQALAQRLTQRLAAGAVVYPPQPLRALALTPLAQVRVVILGQDPYHGPGQAEGLAFSVPPGVALPPSLRNIYAELARDPLLAPWRSPGHGCLQDWARQGVLLLNTCLTVEAQSPASHAGWGWEALTQAVLRAVLQRAQPVAFLLWGGHAQRAAAQAGVAAAAQRLVLQANHPSPLSARRGPQPFLGCGHFSRANAFLRQQGLRPVRW